MFRKILISLLVLSIPLLAVPTVIDSVVVPVKIIKLVKVTGSGSAAEYEYEGKVSYFLKVGDNDSLDTRLEFVPEAGGQSIIPYEVSGDIGIRSFVNGINGQNNVSFKCRITGQPTGQYMARITIIAGLSQIEKSTDSLYDLMTDQERVDQLHGLTGAGVRIGPDIVRLRIPGYMASNGGMGVCNGAEALGGIGGTSTMFPAGCALSCTFDTALVYKMGIALGKEFWAKARPVAEAPMMNMIRDPRGGRNFETFSEDPFLSAMMALAYCKGAQVSKCTIMPKHFICNEQEDNRKTNASIVPERTFREIYAMPFEYAVREAKAWSVMTAQNGLRVLPVDANSGYIWTSENSYALQKMLKDEWGFRGYVMSDWSAIHDAVKAANAGQDVELCSMDHFNYNFLNDVNAGRVSRARFEDMVKRILRTKVWAELIGKLGNSQVMRYATELKSKATEQLCLELARRSIVLVKNDGVLPLNKNSTVAVVGQYADAKRPGSVGSGTACPYYCISPLQGIKNKVGSKVVSTWQSADVVVCVVGTSGEREGSDRTSYNLEPPSGQNDLVNQILTAGKKCVVVVTGGNVCTRDKWYDANGVMIAWFPGQEQGNALADLLYGDVNPSGRISSAFPVSGSQLPAWVHEKGTDVTYEEPDEGRGWYYYEKKNIEPLIPFGFGLSYTTFEYSNLKISPNPAYVGENVTVTVTVKNTGTRAGEEVGQLYIHEKAPKLPRPVKELRGFGRVALEPGQSKELSFTLRERELAYYDHSAGVKRFVCQPDDYDIMVGPSSKSLPLKGVLTMRSPY